MHTHKNPAYLHCWIEEPLYQNNKEDQVLSKSYLP